MNGSSTANASSLRWKILRRALLRKHSSNSDEQSEGVIHRVSRKATKGFNLIPCHVGDDRPAEPSDAFLTRSNQLGSAKDAIFAYKLPVPNSPCIRLCQRVDDGADLNDFEVCNRHNIDNTGIVCQWPSENVLAYYCLSNADMFRGKKVIELGSGYGLAGLVIAAVTEALEVIITDGNPQVVDYIQRSIDANSMAFGGTNVTSMVLHWNDQELDISNRFDTIVASDCTFFKEFHKDLARTIRILLRKQNPSEAILLSPRRGDSLDRFLLEVKDSGLHFTMTEMYNSEVWRLHERFIKGDDDSWPNYEKDHCYPLLVRITL